MFNYYTMTLREYFKKNIMHDVIMCDNAKIFGSFSRDYVYPTDIDIECFVDKNDYNVLMEKINKNYEHIIFLYITLFIDAYKNISVEVKNKSDFSNINFNKIQEQLTKLHSDGLMDNEKYNKLLNYTNNKTLENVLKLELELKSKFKIKWTKSEIQKGSKIVNGKTYNFKEMFETNHDHSTAFVLHWIWVYESTFYIIDIGAIFNSQIKFHSKRNERTSSFYKDMYLLYFEKDYYYLVKSMIYVAIEQRNFKIVKEIHKILEVDYGIHKQSFNKLYEIEKLKSHNFKDLNLNNILESALSIVKTNLKKINFKYNDSESIETNRQNLINFTNESIKVQYNKFRKILTDYNYKLNTMMPALLD